MSESKFEPIDTSQLRGRDYCFVVGWLCSRIALKGKATREDAEQAIAQAILYRPETEK
jgi:hypothetical protein